MSITRYLPSWMNNDEEPEEELNHERLREAALEAQRQNLERQELARRDEIAIGRYTFPNTGMATMVNTFAMPTMATWNAPLTTERIEPTRCEKCGTTNITHFAVRRVGTDTEINRSKINKKKLCMQCHIDYLYELVETVVKARRTLSGINYRDLKWLEDKDEPGDET